MAGRGEQYARVVVDVGPAHLDRLFDYLVPDGQVVGVGSRVRVRFNGRPRTAWVADVVAEPSTDAGRVKPLERVDGTIRWFDTEDLAVWRWVADRYAGTLSGAIRHALPPRVVRVETEAAGWGPPPVGAPAVGVPGVPGFGVVGSPGTRAPVGAGGGVPGFGVVGSPGTRAPVGLAVPLGGGAYHVRAPLHPTAGEGPLIADAVGRCLAAGRQALVIVPSPAPGPGDDVVAAFASAVADLRGEQTEADRYRAFLRALRGEVGVVVGERGVALMPLRSLGLVVVVDEASPAHKERRNPRHHAREAALARGRMTGATVVLTSSVLSAHARRHAVGGHLTLVRAARAEERAAAPPIQVTDRAALPPSARRTRLVGPVAAALAATMAAGGVAIVLAAAKGSGTSLACGECRGRLECPTCGGGIQPSGARGGARSGPASPDGEDRRDPSGSVEIWDCPACAWHGPAFACPDCRSRETFPLRAGAGRFAAELARTHPEAQVVHMEGFDQPGPDRRPAIAVMTRGSVVGRPSWLASLGPPGAPAPADLGSRRSSPPGEEGPDRAPPRATVDHPPGSAADPLSAPAHRLVDLLVIADPDVLLGRPDVEAAEDALRLWLDAARLARRVVVQTGQPTHPALQALVRLDSDGFWTGEHLRRDELGFPPAGSLVRLTGVTPLAAAELRRDVPGTLLGPDHDGAALLKTSALRGTLTALVPLRQRWARDDLRIRVDVDPVGTV